MTAPPELLSFLVDQGLASAGDNVRCEPLTGGVSSDIWRVDLPGRTICVKRALAQLKVAAHWEVSTSRNAFEWAWLCFAARTVPAAAPHPLAHDAEAGLFAMAYLDPGTHPVWKKQLMEGNVDSTAAAAVGTLLARLHASSAYDSQLEHDFDTTENFHSIRIEPYMLATAERHPSLGKRIRELAATTAATRIALVHGDVSPKNILIGPQGPVFLDAECAWYGDPAFDLAFCLNHLLLKCLVWPERHRDYIDAFQRLVAAYFAVPMWESRAGEGGIEHRTALLLPVLLLARVDGKSPVEYIKTDSQRALVREVAIPLIARPTRNLSTILERWALGCAQLASAATDTSTMTTP